MTSPADIRIPQPDALELDRAGKIRWGESEPTGKRSADGVEIVRPKALDYFRVYADENGVTSEAAAEAFHRVYGEKPRELPVVLPGATIDEVFSGAWRLYGANKLKRKCNRRPWLDADEEALCVERAPAGGWSSQKPCVCQDRGIARDHRDHCTCTYTLQVWLLDVPVNGVWQADTGSVISIRNVMRALHTAAMTNPSLSLLEFKLKLVEAKVQPGGQTRTVHVLVLEPVAAKRTLREIMAGDAPAERRGLAVSSTATLVPGPTVAVSAAPSPLPAPAADVARDELLDRSGHEPDGDAAPEEAPASVGRASGETVDEEGRPVQPDVHPSPPGGPDGDPAPLVPPGAADNLKTQLGALDEDQKRVWRDLCQRAGINPGRPSEIIGRFGARSADLAAVIREAKIVEEAIDAQADLPGDEYLELAASFQRWIDAGCPEGARVPRTSSRASAPEQGSLVPVEHRDAS